jgi:Tfp pilus assembly protein PilN
MQAVNLLPAYARPAGRWATIGKELSPASVIRIGGITAAACAILIGGLYFYERATVNDRRSTLADTQARLAAVEATAAPLRIAEASSTARSTVVRTVAASRVSWESVLADLSRVLPDQVSLQNLTALSPTPAAAAVSALSSTTSADTSSTGSTSAAPAPAPVAVAPTSFTITGTTTSHVRVALILDRLALVPWLSDVTLTSSTHASAGDTFGITAGFMPTGGAQ